MCKNSSAITRLCIDFRLYRHSHNVAENTKEHDAITQPIQTRQGLAPVWQHLDVIQANELIQRRTGKRMTDPVTLRYSTIQCRYNIKSYSSENQIPLPRSRCVLFTKWVLGTTLRISFQHIRMENMDITLLAALVLTRSTFEDEQKL